MDGEQRSGLRAAVAAYLCWGLLTIYWKQLVGFDPLEMIGWRIVTATVCMGVVVSFGGRWGAILAIFRDRRSALRITGASVLLAINWTAYVWAVVNERVIETALGYFIAPVGTTAVGVLLLGERLTVLKRWSIGLVLVAVVALTVSYGRFPWVAVALAGTWTWYGFAKRRILLGPIESLTGELLVVVLPAAALMFGGLWRDGGVATTAAGVDWVFLAGTGAITAIPLLLFAHAAPRVPFTVLGPAQYLVPLTNFLLGWLAFGEDLPPERIVGFAIVWVALALVTVDMVRSGDREIRGPDPAGLAG